MTSARAATTREEGAIHVTASARSGSLIDARELPADVVTLDSRVRLVDLDSGEVLLLTVVLPSRANADEGRISVLAPLGMAVLGYRTQDVIEWDVPAAAPGGAAGGLPAGGGQPPPYP